MNSRQAAPPKPPVSTRHVTFVTSDASPELSKLLAAIEAEEYQLTKADHVEDLSKQLKTIPKTTILVYTPQGYDLASQVLTQLSRQDRQCPVIVLVDRADFSHYHELMCEGAYDYYELSEDPEVIARAVRWAAETRAS